MIIMLTNISASKIHSVFVTSFHIFIYTTCQTVSNRQYFAQQIAFHSKFPQTLSTVD